MRNEANGVLLLQGSRVVATGSGGSAGGFRGKILGTLFYWRLIGKTTLGGRFSRIGEK